MCPEHHPVTACGPHRGPARRDFQKRKNMTKYRCRHCLQIVERASRKEWISSWCDGTGKQTRLVRLDKAGKAR